MEDTVSVGPGIGVGNIFGGLRSGPALRLPRVKRTGSAASFEVCVHSSNSNLLESAVGVSEGFQGRFDGVQSTWFPLGRSFLGEVASLFAGRFGEADDVVVDGLVSECLGSGFGRERGDVFVKWRHWR